MALAKKGSRKIVVDSMEYRWTVAPEARTMHLVVEQAKDPGPRLVVIMDYGDEPAPDDTSGQSAQQRSVTPDLVRRCILAGLAHGWRPGERGHGLRMALKGEELIPG